MARLSLCYAAAGSGKTHILVQNYLFHALQSPERFAEILAVTFTNKATQEMKARIIHALLSLVKGDTPLKDTLTTQLGCTVLVLEQKAQQLLTQILHYYEDFAVSTIDAFLQTVVKKFGHLASWGNYTLLLDSNSLEEATMQKLWATLSEHSAIEKAFINLMLHKIAQGKSWDCSQEIDAIKEEAPFSLVALGEDVVAYSGLQDSVFVQQRQEVRNYKKQLQQQASIMLDLIAKAGFKAENFAWGQRGIVGFLTKVSQQKEAKPTARIRKAASAPGPIHWLSTRTTPTASLEALIQDQLQPALQRLLEMYDSNHGDDTTLHALQTLHHITVAKKRFQALFTKECQNTKQIPIRALTAFAKKITSGMPMKVVQDQLDKHYSTVLIDEFQDISTRQWEAMRCFVAHALAQGGSGLLVGDIKQAIYGWRGGNAALFRKQVTKDMSCYPIEKTALPYNWRSLPVIVRFNSVFFRMNARIMATRLLQQHEKDSSEPGFRDLLVQHIAKIPKTYEHVAQKIPPNKAYAEQGYVEMTFFPLQGKKETRTWKEEAAARTLQTIAALQVQGYAAQDIVVLVRSHAEAQFLLSRFIAYKKDQPHQVKAMYEMVTAQRGTTLGHNPYIQLIMHALAYVHAPAPGLLLATLIHFYQKYVMNPGKEAIQVPLEAYWQAAHDEKAASAYLPSGFFEKIPSMVNLPLYLLVCKLVEIFTCPPSARSSMVALQEIVHDFAAQGGYLGSFLAWWEKEGAKKTLPSSAFANNAVRIFTIHQVKGLAFEVVVLPFVSWRLDHMPRKAPILWCTTDKDPFRSLGKVPVYYHKKLQETHYKEDYYAEKTNIYLENLNLLYVACTRAKRALYVFTPAGHGFSRVSDLLYGTLLETYFRGMLTWQETKEQGITTFSLGSLPAPKHAVKPTKPAVFSFHHTTHHHGACLHGLQTEEAKEGMWWHTLLSHIVTKQDVPHVLATYVATQKLTATAADDVAAKMETWWQNARLADWFSGHWEVLQEACILLPDGRSLRPDRVMVQGKRAVVLDFKTGERNAKDNAQVAQYVALLKQMHYKPVEGYLFYTKENSLEAV